MYPYLITGVICLTALCMLLLCRICCQRRCMLTAKFINDELLRNVAAYVLLVDKDFNVLQTNYYAITGTSPKTMPKVGNLLRCKNGEDAGMCGTHALCRQCPVRAAIAEAFRTKRNFSGLETPMTLYTDAECRQSVECEVSVAGNYMTIEEHPRLVLTVNDITTLKHTQRELSEARVRAEESDRMKSLFLANTSHELRTPLNAIIGFSELLTGDLTPGEREEYIHFIRTNNELLLQLVNDILDLSKIEAGTLEYKFAEVEVDAVMEELEWFYRKKLPESSTVRIIYQRSDTSCLLYTDRIRLSQVVSNFLSNAMKFTREGEIVFGYEERGDELYFYVRDTGTGIPEDRVDQVFKRFVKIGSHKQGVGIGLAICKSIVESMGGRIGVESTVGKGSTFWFTLPRHRQEPIGEVSARRQ